MAKPSSESVLSYPVGLNKGFVTTKIKKVPRPSNRKARTSNRVRQIRQLMTSVADLSFFEKRILEMLKSGVTKVEKRAFKLLKKRLGSRSRAMKKEEKLRNIIKNLAAKKK